MSQRDVYKDLVAEGADLDHLVADLEPDAWTLDTPAPGWTVAHQIAHLAATFRLASVAATSTAAFQAIAAKLSPDFDANVAAAMAGYLAEPPDVLLSRWRHERAAAETALARLPHDQTVPWVVRPLPAGVLAAAGIMELFAHGQDVADALGERREPTDRLWHLAAFAVRNWDFGYQVRGLTPPAEPFRFTLTAPSGAVWRFGPEDARQHVSGPAVDFCLLVTRRRHPADLDVRADGADAEQWLGIAQAYRGTAGPGRLPGQFANARH
ncbi:MAG: TIGR03084 family protein [Actinobacteria bacterium 13_2_20CM_2_71_6]|nr:MAG: TIGR03084 family protein [Actinobacteria bacterium 13_2_20CM_2_71_6]